MSEGMKDLLAPLKSLQFVPREKLQANDYNPNRVTKENLRLLKQSILMNGWTLPIVVRPDYTIIDGFHRWTVSGDPELHDRLGGVVPVVIVDHQGDRAADMYGTITHNRARGTHLLEPMKKIVQELLDSGKTIQEISKQLGMKPEEVFRLSRFSREEFLEILTQHQQQYSKARVYMEM
ncbi:ParB/RepB/Spo0J family partition protein [Geobacillus stearothermophilus]|uniref:IbrB-like domain-containing protein n=1 Tax=Geobacillus stearothermophilus TaxID=1422 RepID=UPI002E23242E|nr:ParB/RepB/Spo0J family partition protein [Geobacillus stearothermophilus]